MYKRQVQDFTNVQDVIDNYETKVTTNFLDDGFHYKTVFDTIHEDTIGTVSYTHLDVYKRQVLDLIRIHASSL